MEQYIKKSALVARIERGLNAYKDEYNRTGDTYAFVLKGEVEDILYFINTLEVKEMEEEPENRELEEAAEEYAKSTLVGSMSVKKNAFKAGVLWNKH